MADNAQALTIFEPRNVQTLAELAPRSYRDNQLSHTRCLEVGSALLLKVRKEGEIVKMQIKKISWQATGNSSFADNL